MFHNRFLAIAAGLRVCIGQRFAMVEMKIAATKMLAKHKFSPTAEGSKMDLYKGDAFMLSYPELKLKVEDRK